MADIFTIDGKPYDVNVLELTCGFSVKDTNNTGFCIDGGVIRDIVGTYYNYTMKLAAKPGNYEDIDALWEVLSSPQESHVCVFPYNQETVTQRMYVTSGERPLIRLDKRRKMWGSVTINFIAAEPKRKP